MTQQASIGTSKSQCTCTACPLLCEDIKLEPAGAHSACSFGKAAFDAAAAAFAAGSEAWINGKPEGLQAAIDRAAADLIAARRVLITGLADATLEAVTAACDLAESLGAAIDAGLPESAQAAGPTIARAGGVTAAWDELRDRADLVIFWCSDPTASHPRFVERFIAPPLASGKPRVCIALGSGPALPLGREFSQLPLASDLAVEAARCLQVLVAGRELADTLPLLDTGFAATCTALQTAIGAADCVAIVSSNAADPVGLEDWSIVHLVRTIAHLKPAFQILLGAGTAAGGGNGAGAAAVCTWRYAAAGAIARADRSGGLFLPGEADARRLIKWGEVDAVVAVGRLSPLIEAAIMARGPALSVVRICDQPQPVPPAGSHVVQLRSASQLLATPGTMLREDGCQVVLTVARDSTTPLLRELLVKLTTAVQQSPSATAVRGRP